MERRTDAVHRIGGSWIECQLSSSKQVKRRMVLSMQWDLFDEKRHSARSSSTGPVMLWLGPLREKSCLALLRRGTNLGEFRPRSQVRQQRVGIDRRIRTISARDRLPEAATCGFGLPAVGKVRRRKVIYFRIRRRFTP